MAEEVNVQKEFVNSVIKKADMSDPNAVRAANDVLKTYNDLQVEEARLQQNERSQNQKDRELDLKEQELKQSKIDSYISSGITLASLIASVGAVFKYMKFTESGNAITSTVGKTILNGFKLFSKVK